MKKQNWQKEAPFSIVLCDKKGTVLEMNEKACATFAKWGGKKLIGKTLLDCHPKKARNKLKRMLKSQKLNVYTIEKNGIKKMIYQSPWYKNGKYMGFIELSLPISTKIPHFMRK